MAQVALRITGMTCGHCVAAVTKALQSVPGVESVEVNLEKGQGLIKGQAEAAQLIKAVESEGYEAETMRS
jgi:copper chaperone